MTILTARIRDIAGADDRTTFTFEIPTVRGATDGGIVTVRERRYTAEYGQLTTDDLEPGPAVLHLSGGLSRSFTINIPEADEAVQLWPLIEAQVEYEPPVVSKVHEDRLRAEAAAAEAVAAAATVEDVAEDAAAVAEHRTVIESIRGEVQSTAQSVSTAVDEAADAASSAGAARQGAESARDDAVEARTDAVAAREAAEDFRALSSASALTATQKAEEAEAAALEAAGYVGSVLDGAITTPKLADDAVTSPKLAPAVRNDLAGREQSANKGQANGYAPLDAGAKIPAAHLPSYVDDVVEFANQSAFPATGEGGKIYTALDTNRIYRWSGSAYVEISPSPGSTDAVTEGATNKYYTDARARAAVADDIAAKYTKPAAGIPASDLAAGRVVGSVNGIATNLTIWVGTEAQYTAIGTKDPSTIYFRT